MSKKRYTDEKQILADIDACHAKSRRFYAEADEMDKQATELFKTGRLVEEAKHLRIMANQKRTRAHNLANKKAKALGEKFSGFRTATMATVPDNSIQA